MKGSSGLHWYLKVYTFLSENKCYLITPKLDDKIRKVLIDSTSFDTRIRVNSEHRTYGLFIGRGKSGNSMIITQPSFEDFCKKNGLCLDELIDNKAVLPYTATMFHNCRHSKNVENAKKKLLAKQKKNDYRANVLNNPLSTSAQKRNVALDIWADKILEKKEVATTSYENRLYSKLYNVYKKRVKRQQKFIVHGKVYFADIYMKAYKAIIEVDGGYHNKPEQIEKDRRRDLDLSSLGLLVIRIKNADISKVFKPLLYMLDSRHANIIKGIPCSTGTIHLTVKK